jgi:type I restriction enzyme, S subunit
MQRYENYKPSGIQWVEKIPSHWGTERAKWLFNRMERPVRPEDDVVTAFRDGQVTLRTNRRTEGFTNAIQEHGYQGIRKGDLVIHAMDAFAGAIGVSDSDGKSTPVYAACVPRGEYPVNSYYYAYLLRYMAHSGYIESLSKGIRERSTDFRFAEFRELPLPIPDKDEQDRIVAFLDQKTAEIDAAIAKKERLIELLEGQKTSLIYQATSKGIQPKKRSTQKTNLPWLNEIPIDWNISRLKSLAAFITSGPRGWSDRLSDEGAIFVQSGNLNDSLGLNIEDANRVSVPKGAEAKRTRLKDADVVICITGANTGRVAVADIGEQEAYINQHLSLVRIKGVNPRFVAYSLSTPGSTYFYLCQYGLKEGLSLFDVANAPVALPPSAEQDEIVKFLDNGVTRVDSAVVSAQNQIDQLHELKRTLVSAAVTGKLKP